MLMGSQRLHLKHGTKENQTSVLLLTIYPDSHVYTSAKSIKFTKSISNKTIKTLKSIFTRNHFTTVIKNQNCPF